MEVAIWSATVIDPADCRIDGSTLNALSSSFKQRKRQLQTQEIQVWDSGTTRRDAGEAKSQSSQ